MEQTTVTPSAHCLFSYYSWRKKRGKHWRKRTRKDRRRGSRGSLIPGVTAGGQSDKKASSEVIQVLSLPAERRPGPGGAQTEQRAKVTDAWQAEHPDGPRVHLPSGQSRCLMTSLPCRSPASRHTRSAVGGDRGGFLNTLEVISGGSFSVHRNKAVKRTSSSHVTDTRCCLNALLRCFQNISGGCGSVSDGPLLLELTRFHGFPGGDDGGEQRSVSLSESSKKINVDPPKKGS